MKAAFLLVAAVSAIAAAERVGDIEFYGYKGFDTAKIRAALPVTEGDAFSEKTQEAIRQAVVKQIGKEPTEVAVVCCDEKGSQSIFIGLPGASYRSFTYNPAPRGADRLSPDILVLSSRLDDAFVAAVRKGGNAATEDDSNGYALLNDPDARSLQLAGREWALGHEREIFRVLSNSSDVENRRIAAELLGYATQSKDQILALVRAARDPDKDVRNNVTRALGVLAGAKPSRASEIPPDTFIQMLNSGIWTDRNKGAGLIAQLTVSRDPVLLAKIRSEALDSCIEMASWRRFGHASFARTVLGRVAGIPEDRLNDLAYQGPVATIVEAARRP